MASTDLAVIYAALILADDGVTIVPEKILALTNAAAIDLEPIWATLLANALKDKDIHDMLSNIHAVGNTVQAPNTLLAPLVHAADAPEPDGDPPQDDDEDSDGDLMFPSLWDM